MDAVIDPAPTRRPSTWRSRIGPTLVLIVCGLFFVLPMITMARYSLQNIITPLLRWEDVFKKWSLSGIKAAVSDPGFWPALKLSLELAVATVALTLLLLLPTLLLVHIKVPKARPLIEFTTLLPFMIPPIALVAGVAAFFRPNAKWFLNSNFSLVPFYAILALPFTFRAIDAGIRAIDVRTLIDASRSLGAGWGRTLFRVLMPNLKMAIVSSSFLTFTVVMGEFTIAQTLLKRTYPQFMYEFYSNRGQGATALALFTFLATTAVLGLMFFFVRRRDRRAGTTTTVF